MEVLLNYEKFWTKCKVCLPVKFNVRPWSCQFQIRESDKLFIEYTGYKSVWLARLGKYYSKVWLRLGRGVKRG